MHAPHLSKIDVVMTLLSAAAEATLIWRFVNKRWFCG